VLPSLGIRAEGATFVIRDAAHSPAEGRGSYARAEQIERRADLKPQSKKIFTKNFSRGFPVAAV
jgi:hypothetical protein